ncbi:uncharacterized protein LOC143920220 [Arctopsyche grandis]|uniref:uncharacterized protein LOC143920220 n=1 Tax=Arctopsyche grandis TaxID=121162 RepID=UPI00406D95B1
MFSPTWTRPLSVEYPQVWSRFEKTTNDGKVLQLKIQDVTEDHYEGILELATTEFIRDEPWYSNTGFPDDSASVAIVREYMMKVVFPQKVSVVCLLEDEDGSKLKIVGFNYLGICCKNDIEDVGEFIKTQATTTLLILYEAYKAESPNIFDKYNVESYLGAMGLFVKREYRGLRISTEILKARLPLCKAIGIGISNTIFTAIASQKSARKAGFEVDAVVSYDILRKATGLEFKNCLNCEQMTLIIK